MSTRLQGPPVTTIPEARFSVERKLLELSAGGGPPLIAQIDAVLTDLPQAGSVLRSKKVLLF